MANKWGGGGWRRINILGRLGFLGKTISICGGTSAHVKLIPVYCWGKKEKHISFQ